MILKFVGLSEVHSVLRIISFIILVLLGVAVVLYIYIYFRIVQGGVILFSGVMVKIKRYAIKYGLANYTHAEYEPFKMRND